MRKHILVRITSVFLLAAMLAGCGSEADTSTSHETEMQTEAAAETTAATEAPVETTETIPPNCVIVSTPFGNLQYQDQWMEFMRVEQRREGDNMIVSFCAEINSVRYSLFDITIGTSDDTAVGQITDADGVKRDVYIHMAELTETNALTDNEQNRLYAMQEDINYIIENLK